MSPGVLLEGGQVLGEHRHIRRIHDLYRLDLIPLAATAKSMLEDEFLSPALLAASAKRYRHPESKIEGWLKPPQYFTGGCFLHMAGDNILRGNDRKRAPPLYEQGLSLAGMPWIGLISPH